MKYPAFALTVNPAAPIVSQGQLVLGAGEREKWYLSQNIGWERWEGLQGECDSIVTSIEWEQDGL